MPTATQHDVEITMYIRGIGRGETAEMCLATSIVGSVLPMSISYCILSLIPVLSSPLPVEIVHRYLTPGPLVAGSLVARNMSPTPSMMGMMLLVVIVIRVVVRVSHLQAPPLPLPLHSSPLLLTFPLALALLRDLQLQLLLLRSRRPAPIRADTLAPRITAIAELGPVDVRLGGHAKLAAFLPLRTHAREAATAVAHPGLLFLLPGGKALWPSTRCR